MKDYNLVYIDDNIDNALESYLDQYSCKDSNNVIHFSEVKFNPQEGYESLLNNPIVQEANIIVIDDWLFEQKNAQQGKFTGEEFKLVLRKYYPFIEVIVITQNPPDPDTHTLSKYNANINVGLSPESYYDSYVSNCIEAAIDNISTYRKLSIKLRSNTNWEKVLTEKIVNSLEGTSSYDELSKSDIDSLIEAFKEVQRQLDDES